MIAVQSRKRQFHDHSLFMVADITWWQITVFAYITSNYDLREFQNNFSGLFISFETEKFQKKSSVGFKMVSKFSQHHSLVIRLDPGVTQTDWTSRWVKKEGVKFYQKNLWSMIYSPWTIDGRIDVGDGCWRRNLLVTILRVCWRFWPLSLNISIGNQHPKDVTKILILSPTFLNCHQV